jgi:hypothetical protein
VGTGQGGIAALGPFNHATCIMALMNIEPLSPVLEGLARLLPGRGRVVSVILHPAFRAMGQTSWGWDEGATAERVPERRQGSRAKRGGGPEPLTGKQYRRVDGYLSPGQREIVMNPGAASSGAEPVVTLTFHRAIQHYIKAHADAGFMVDALEEWPSVRMSEPGPRAKEENRARREIPMFLAIRGVRNW